MLALARPSVGAWKNLASSTVPLALRPQHLGRRAQGDQRRGQRRGVDDDARVALGEDGVVAVLAVQGEALVAALEQAVDVLVAEVPAAVALAQVAAERAHVADLRPADLAGRRRQRRDSACAASALLGDVRQLDAGADRDVGASSPSTLDLRSAPSMPPRLTTLSGWAMYSFCRSSRSVPPASSSVVPHLASSRPTACFGGRRPVVGEVLHVAFPPFAARAASTRSGVNGVCGTRTPMALKTALPMAACVEMVGGSPMPMTPRSGMSVMWTMICGMSSMPPSL